MDYIIEKKVHSDMNKVKNIVEEILHSIRGSVNGNIYFNTKLILSELIINGVLHGNKEDVSKLIIIKLMINRSYIIIQVTDEGTGITYKHKELGVYDYCESGRGLMLVEGLSDEFLVDGNKIVCIQYL